jgi:hypothetical protein
MKLLCSLRAGAGNDEASFGVGDSTIDAVGGLVAAASPTFMGSVGPKEESSTFVGPQVGRERRPLG